MKRPAKSFPPTIFILLASTLMFGADFRAEQKRYPRVRTAYEEKEESIKSRLAENKIDSFSVDVFIRVFKKEEILEVWVKEKSSEKFSHLVDYEFCSTSGTLGPKRKEGDGQIPEGCYHVSTFNPHSRFYLSLGINYPNRADRILGDRSEPGSDIFIHGSCVTIGCIPITDDKIKELYLLAVEAKNSGQADIPVHIFPTRMTGDNFGTLEEENAHNENLLTFWENLKPVFDHFETNKALPDVSVNSRGEYVIGN